MSCKHLVESLEERVARAIMKTMEDYLEETGQSQKVTTEFGQGVAFSTGAIVSRVKAVFEEEKQWLKDNGQYF